MPKFLTLFSPSTDQGGGGGGGLQNDVLKMAQQHASASAGSSGNSDLFSNIMNAVGQKQDKIQNEDIDEEGAFKGIFDHMVFFFSLPRSGF